MSYTPKTFGMVLNRFFEILRGHWKTLLGVGLIPIFVFMLVVLSWAAVFAWKIYQLKEQGVDHPDFTFFLWIFLPILPVFLFMVLVMALYMAAAAYVTTKLNLGETVSVANAWRFAFSNIWRYVWLYIRQWLVVMVPLIAVFTFVAGGAFALIALTGNAHGDNSNFIFLMPLIPLCYLGFFVYAIWINIRLSFSYYASVTEDLSAATSMARSWQMTRGIFWRIFLVLLIVYAMLYAAQMVVFIVFEFVAVIVVFIAIALEVQQHLAILFTLGGVGVLFLSVFFGVLISASHAAYATALTILYEDRRRELLPDASNVVGEIAGAQS